MGPSDLRVEAYKLLQDWSKWLVTLETAVCAGLWPSLTGPQNPPLSLVAGWVLFACSIVTAAVLLVLIPYVIGQLGSGRQSGGRGIRTAVAVEYGLFLLGVVCFVWRAMEASLR